MVVGTVASLKVVWEECSREYRFLQCPLWGESVAIGEMNNNWCKWRE